MAEEKNRAGVEAAPVNGAAAGDVRAEAADGVKAAGETRAAKATSVKAAGETRAAKASGAKPARTPKKKGPIERLHPWAAQVRAWFFSDAWSAALVWFAIVVVCVAVLVWFFVFSSYGAPAVPIYQDF